MAATKTVLRVTNNRAIVRVIGTTAGDTATIALNTDLVGAGDALTSGGTPTANISMVKTSSLNSITITRNSTVIAAFYGSDSTDQPEFIFSDAPTNDIIVTFVGGGGMILLDITKVAGYSPKFEPGSFGGGDNIANVGS